MKILNWMTFLVSKICTLGHRQISLLKGQYILALILLVLLVFIAPKGQTENSLQTTISPSTSYSLGLNGQWKSSIFFESFEQSSDDSKVAGVSFQSQLAYRFNQSVNLKLDSAIGFQNGRIQERYRKTPSGSAILVREAVSQFRANPALNVDAGLVNQGFLNSNLLISHNRAFPGIKIYGQKTGEGISPFYSIQQSIPTSRSFDDERTAKEDLPLFATASVGLQYENKQNYNLKGQLSYYNFSDLPSSVAYESQFRGNHSSGENEFVNDANFSFDFSGLLFTGSYLQNISDNFSSKIQYHFIRNLEAKKSFDTGQFISASLTHKTSNLEWGPSFEIFYNESDTAPSYYGKSEYGYNNRQGQALGLQFAFPKLSFLVSGKYVISETINDNPHQDQLDNFILELETYYVQF